MRSFFPLFAHYSVYFFCFFSGVPMVYRSIFQFQHSWKVCLRQILPDHRAINRVSSLLGYPLPLMFEKLSVMFKLCPPLFKYRLDILDYLPPLLKYFHIPCKALQLILNTSHRTEKSLESDVQILSHCFAFVLLVIKVHICFHVSHVSFYFLILISLQKKKKGEIWTSLVCGCMLITCSMFIWHVFIWMHWNKSKGTWS